MTAKTDELLVTCRKVFPALKWERCETDHPETVWKIYAGSDDGDECYIRLDWFYARVRDAQWHAVYIGAAAQIACIDVAAPEKALAALMMAMRKEAEALTKAGGTDATAAQVAELTAEVALLRGLVEAAYCEGFATGNSLPRCDIAELWDCSNARKALGGWQVYGPECKPDVGVPCVLRNESGCLKCVTLDSDSDWNNVQRREIWTAHDGDLFMILPEVPK